MDFRKRRMMVMEAFMGEPTGMVGEVAAQTSFAECEDGGFARQSAVGADGYFGGGYDISAGGAVTGEGFVF